MLGWHRDILKGKHFSTTTYPVIQKTLPPERPQTLTRLQLEDYVIYLKRRNIVLGKVKQLDPKFEKLSKIESEFQLSSAYLDDIPIVLGQFEDAKDVDDLMDMALAFSKVLTPTILKLTEVYVSC
jgi:hypothetical protein